MSATKQLILEASLELFATNGYEKTTIALILKKTGLSKGGFYHHFRSKEEILEHLTRSRIDQAIQIVEAIVNREGFSAIDKLNELFEEMMAFRKKNAAQTFKIFESYLKDENLLWRKKMDDYTMSRALKYYVSIIEQGKNEGIFNVSDPALAAEVILREVPVFRTKMALIYLERENIADYIGEIIRIASYTDEFIHRILGAQSGLLKLKDMFVRFFLEIQ